MPTIPPQITTFPDPVKMASSLIGNPKEKWIRSFTVTEPTKHIKGFTVYKVTYKVCHI